MRKRTVILAGLLAASLVLGGCAASKGLETDAIKITNYKEVEVDAVDKPEEITEEDVDASIQATLESEAETTEITDRPVEEGDTVNIDFVGKLNGEAFDGGSGEDYLLTIGSGTFIEGFEDVMNMETGALKYIMNLLKTEYSKETELLHADIPEITEIPTIKFADAKQLLIDKMKYKPSDMKDFDPEEENLLGKYAKKEFGSDFLFVTHYPTIKRPFYTMDDPENPEYTLSFDLLFRGLEITSGGQRVHDYNMQVEKMKRMGVNPEAFDTYLMLHKYGAPPHGGLGIGLERLTMHLLGFKNVREATMFPRDINRVTP